MARRLGVSPQAVNEWKQGNRPVPVVHCLAIEQATEGKVTRRDLRPDDWQRIWPELSDQSPATLPHDVPNGQKAREAAGPIGRGNPKVPE